MARALVAAYLQYASLGPPPSALHLDRFERPGLGAETGPFADTQPAAGYPSLRVLAAAYLEYASFGPSRAALHLGPLERPEWRRFVQDVP
jgi:hypothetical protein